VITNTFDIEGSTARVVSMDTFISDNNDNAFIKLRVSVSDIGRLFYSIPLYTDKLGDRSKNSAAGTQSYFTADASYDGYVLFSPYSSFNEVEENSDVISFSYPLESIFYRRQKSYNDEDFNFNISSYSHSFVIDNVSLINIPGYRKMAALHVDANIHKELSNIATNAFINIDSEGTLSGVTDTFRVNFIR